MRIILIFLISSTSLNVCLAQAVAAKEIDQQVWALFKEAYKTNDATLYNSIHTSDVLRVTPGGIRIGDEYLQSNVASMGRPNMPPITIDFVFEHRVHRQEIGYEVGYYKVEYYKEGKMEKESYGRFHVVLKKENGVWKIAQDWDSSNINGHEVTAEDFLRLQLK